MAEATVPHGKSPACSCLVRAFLDGITAGPRRGPAQRCRCQVRAVCTGWAVPPAPAARAPALPSGPRRQEAAEPVPLHGGGRPRSRLGSARPAGNAQFRSAPLDCVRFSSFGSARSHSAPLVCELGSSRHRRICPLGPSSLCPLSYIRLCPNPLGSARALAIARLEGLDPTLQHS